MLIIQAVMSALPLASVRPDHSYCRSKSKFML